MGAPMSGRASVQVGGSITERLVIALTAAWSAIQDRHPDVPDVVLTLGSGRSGHAGARSPGATSPPAVGTSPSPPATPTTARTTRAALRTRWPPGLAELFVGGEGLRRGARAVLGTLLHEAAHGVATTRGIKDTSRQSRYHNKKFAELAAELGIVVEPDGARGWSATTLPDDTAAMYVAELAQLTEAITAYRSAEATGGGGTTSRNNPPATCGCVPARRVRVARSVLAAGPIVCGVCGSEFTVDEPDGDPDEEQG